MVEGIVLAAGSSSRAGSFKMELPVGDKTLIERSIEGMYNVCSRIIVVGGYRVERVREILRGNTKVEVVENANWRSGMFSSVKVGITSVRSEKCFLLPADVPLVPNSVYQKMLSVHAEIVIPTYKGAKGHPVLVRSSVIEHIMMRPDDSSLRDVIQQTGYSTIEVEEERILWDVDTIDDYKKLRLNVEPAELTATLF